MFGSYACVLSVPTFFYFRYQTVYVIAFANATAIVSFIHRNNVCYEEGRANVLQHLGLHSRALMLFGPFSLFCLTRIAIFIVSVSILMIASIPLSLK